MKRELIFNKVVEIIDDKIGAFKPIKEEDHFYNTMGFDSLDNIELIMECEKEFDIAIPDEDVEKIETVKQAVDYLESVLNK